VPFYVICHRRLFFSLLSSLWPCAPQTSEEKSKEKAKKKKRKRKGKSVGGVVGKKGFGRACARVLLHTRGFRGASLFHFLCFFFSGLVDETFYI
jgi:hypothetical protein